MTNLNQCHSMCGTLKNPYYSMPSIRLKFAAIHDIGGRLYKSEKILNGTNSP